MQNVQCKICRRLGIKLFLKGDRCFSQKCAMVRKPYAPGQKKKRRRGGISEYGKELREKQKLRNWYNLREKNFKNYVKKASSQRGKVEDAPTLLIRELEKRLDNVVFRLGFASSRPQARNLVSHGHFLVNGKATNSPSRRLNKGDKISLRSFAQKKNFFKNRQIILKKHTVPAWLKLNVEKLEGEILREPTLEEVVPPVEISLIFEYYSR